MRSRIASGCFYLEEVENLRVADGRVYAGRRLHVKLERLEDEDEWLKLNLESERWGLAGKVDCVRRRDGMLIPYEHKKGRSAVSATGLPEAWASDRLQVIAYAALVGEHSGRKVMRIPMMPKGVEHLSTLDILLGVFMSEFQ